MELPIENDSRPGVEPWFAYTVGILLLVVVAGLTGLSLRLYTRARLAEARAAQTQASLDQQQQALSLLGERLSDISARLDRRSLTTRPARLDDRDITLLEASAGAGRAIGLRPGDVLQVMPPPQTSSAPAATQED